MRNYISSAIITLSVLISGPMLALPASAQAACIPTPPNYSQCGWPDASNTGPVPGTVFTDVTPDSSGNYYIKQSNVTINGLRLKGQIIVQGNNVTIQNCDVNASGKLAAVSAGSGYTKLNVLHCRLYGDPSLGRTAGHVLTATGGDGEYAYNEIYGVENGMGLGGYIHDNYIHDMPVWDSLDHTDAIQGYGGTGGNSQIIHNTLMVVCETGDCTPTNYKGGSSATAMANGDHDITVDDNLIIDAAGSYAFYGPSEAQNGGVPTANIHVTNNVFSRYWGDYSTHTGFIGTAPGFIWSGNYWLDTGQAIPCNCGESQSGDTTPPSTPTNLSATAISPSQINLSWTASTDNVGVTGYRVYRNGTQVGTPTGTSYSDTGLTASTAYSYYVRAVDAAGNVSGNSNTASATTQAAPPSGSTITIGETNILSANDSGNGNLLVSQNATLPQTATIQSLSFYVTTAGGDLRLGIYDATGPGGGPGALKAQTNSFTPTTGWNTQPVTSQVSLPAGTYWLAYLPSSNTLAFRKGNVSGTSGKYYTYTFGTLPSPFSTAPNTTTSHWSFYATLSIPDTTPPSTPTNLSATAISPSQINLSWTASTDNVGVTGYRVYRNGTQVGTPTGTSYSDTGLTASTAYSYYVRAVDAAGNVSGNSNTASATTQAAPPSGSTITIGETNILSANDSGNGNLLVSQNATLPQTATIQSLSFYVTTAGGDLRLGIYDATGPGGGPGALKAQTNSFTPTTGWNTQPVTSQVSLPAGTYWLAYLPSSNTLAFRKGNVSGTSGKYYTYTFGTLPSPFSTAPNTTTSHWSFYATLSIPDTTPPSTPTNLSATAISPSQINLSWTASTDNVGVTGYKIFRGGVQVGTATTNSYSDTGLSPSTAYTYTVSAYNAAGNNSAQSGSASATTLPPPPTVVLSASPQSIGTGDSSTLSWTSINASSCTGTGFSTGGAVSGSAVVTPSATTVYSISCTGAGGTGTNTVTVSVGALAALPTIDFPSGTFTWTTTNAVSCTASGGWTGAVGTSGSYTFSTPLSSTYVLTCTGGGTTVQRTITITTSETATVSSKFQIGGSVTTASALNVRSSPATSGALLGTQPAGASGTVTGGPVQANGYWWWQVDYATGPDGWSVENWLQ